MIPQQPTVSDRALAAFRMLVRGEFPQLGYQGIYEYSVQSSDGSTVDCDATDTTISLPSHLAKVPLRSSILGAQVTPSSGSRCLIMFVNADPSRPVCVFVEPTPVTATIATAGGLNPGTLNLKGGGMPTTEHVATVEGVLNLFTNFIFFLQAVGNPSTWSGAGKILDPADTPLATLQSQLATWILNCNGAVLPTPTNGGGILLAGVVGSIAAQLAVKLPSIPGVTPTNIGAPNVKTG